MYYITELVFSSPSGMHITLSEEAVVFLTVGQWKEIPRS